MKLVDAWNHSLCDHVCHRLWDCMSDTLIPVLAKVRLRKMASSLCRESILSCITSTCCSSERKAERTTPAVNCELALEQDSMLGKNGNMNQNLFYAPLVLKRPRTTRKSVLLVLRDCQVVVVFFFLFFFFCFFFTNPSLLYASFVSR